MPTGTYLRISTGGQSVESQRLVIIDYAHYHGLTVQTFVEARTSAYQACARLGVAALLEQLHLVTMKESRGIRVRRDN